VRLVLERVVLEPGGPLPRGIDVAPGTLTILRGPNESGKSYVLDAVLAILFPRERKLPGTRQWEDLRGIVTVSLDGERSEFSLPAGRRRRSLSDLLDCRGLPAGIAGILSCRGHDVALSSGPSAYGADRGLLAEVLAGKGLLEELDSAIPALLRKMSWEEGAPQGTRAGRIAEWYASREALVDSEKLLYGLAANPAVLGMRRLEERTSAAAARLQEMEKSRKAEAWRVYERAGALSAELSGMPDTGTLAGLANALEEHSTAAAELAHHEKARAELQVSREMDTWAAGALAGWNEALASSRPPSWPLLLASLLPVAAAAVLSVAGLGAHAAVLAVTGLFTSLFALVRLRSYARAARRLDEIEQIRSEWTERFGTAIRGSADLVHLRERLAPDMQTLTGLELAIRRESLRMAQLAGRLESLGPGGPPAWRAALDSLLARRHSLEKSILDCQQRVAALGGTTGPPPGDAGSTFDQDAFDDAREELDTLRRETEAAERSFVETCAGAGIPATGRPVRTAGELLTLLEERRDRAGEAFCSVSTELLAQTAVRDAVEGMRQRQDEMLRDALESADLSAPLSRLTSGRWRAWDLDEKTLLLVSADGRRMPLDRLSTGTAEQAMLALRIGLLRRTVGLDGAFLLMDDPLRHTDGPRLGNAVELVAAVAEEGWQMIVCTMDDSLGDALAGAVAGAVTVTLDGPGGACS
jgi:hypothetical protein